jgi:hypothetical protein
VNTTQFGRIYGRFSSKPQERGDSKRRQIEGAKKYAQKAGITIIGEPFFDEGVSGKAGLNLEKEFGRLLSESKDGDMIRAALRVCIISLMSAFIGKGLNEFYDFAVNPIDLDYKWKATGP